MLTFFLILVSLVLGLLVDEDVGWLFGAATGVVLSRLFAREQAKRTALEAKLIAELTLLRARVDQQESVLRDLWDGARTTSALRAGQTPVAQQAPVAEQALAPEQAIRTDAAPKVDAGAESFPISRSDTATVAAWTTQDAQTPPPVAEGSTDALQSDETHPSAELPPRDETLTVAALEGTETPPAEPSLPQTSPLKAPPEVRAAYAPPLAAPTSPPDPIEQGLLWIRDFLFGGNTVVRAGIVVLLVGVTLLLKYAAEHSLFPIELRMASGAGAGLSLILVGLRLRKLRSGFGETLQGGGIATMYLVVFFSFRVYHLLPAGLAFGLLAAIACLSAVLAVVQNALPLIVIGQVGGFLAPLLASSGKGDHVALFSYYLVLNLLIAGVAWFRAWRPLNLVGFAFTFGIGTVWGVLRYGPEDLHSTEPFLVAFFLLYVAIPVLFALKSQTKGWVDGSLVFGAPLAFLGLQVGLVEHLPFAMAYTTIGLCALYIGLAHLFRRRRFENFTLMRFSFLALGVGFATLAIPYGFDSSGLSAATWAVEGAGLYFLGVRQQRFLSRAAGVGLQALAGGTLLLYFHAPPPSGALPFLHGRVLAATFLALGSCFIAAQAHLHRKQLTQPESAGLQVLIFWALALLLPALDDELVRVTSVWWLPGARLGALGLLGLLLETIGRRLQWPWVRYAPASLVFLLIPFLLVWHNEVPPHLLAHGGAFAWPLYFASVLSTLRRFAPATQGHWGSLHPVSLWGATLFGSLLLAEVCTGPLTLSPPWSSAAFGLGLVAAHFGLGLRKVDKYWPISDEPSLYLGIGRRMLGFFVLFWTLKTTLSSALDDSVLGYVPLLNPVELVQLLALGSLVLWLRSEAARPMHLSLRLRAWLPPLLPVLGFLIWNAILARTAHRYFDVRWDEQDLWECGPLQVAISISWTMIGLLVTVLASRRKHRSQWMVGATLLAVVVFKLFTVDLASLSTLSKIGTFLAVGMLLLLVGYFSPVPPAHAELSEPSPEPLPKPVPVPTPEQEPMPTKKPSSDDATPAKK